MVYLNTRLLSPHMLRNMVFSMGRAVRYISNSSLLRHQMSVGNQCKMIPTTTSHPYKNNAGLMSVVNNRNIRLSQNPGCRLLQNGSHLVSASTCLVYTIDSQYLVPLLQIFVTLSPPVCYCLLISYRVCPPSIWLPINQRCFQTACYWAPFYDWEPGK